MNGAHSDIESARDALHFIPSDMPREEWVKAGMAAQSAGLTFDDFDNWSSTAGNYKANDTRDTWRSFKPGKGISKATLFSMAKENGYKPGASRPVIDYTAVVKKAKPAPKPAPGMSAGEVWARCQPATYSHPYFAAKGGIHAPLDTLRVLPADDGMWINGQNMAGALVVPGYAPDGALQSLQLIPPTTPKMNLPGSPMKGASFTVGKIEPGATVYIVEGIGAAWACWAPNTAAAVVCFGVHNMQQVASQLRQRDPTARLVVVADAGKEKQAEAIAKEVQGFFVTMPEGEKNNFDANDLGIRDGFDVLADLLDNPKEPPKPAPHPLAKYVEFDAKPMAPRWVIPGFIGHGVTIIAGAHGVGKTTALLPLAMVAAGLHVAYDLLAPKHWRHVVYIVEDIEQARRIIAGMVQSSMGLDPAVVRERLHIVEARRLDPDHVAQVGKTYREQFTRNVNGVDLLPLVVVDTKAAVLDLENENDNSEASKAMAALKQGFEGLPVWLIGHIAKQNIGRSDVAGLSLRGGSAFEADANQVLYLVQEAESRYLVRGKTRFEAKWPELEIKSYCAEIQAQDEFGDYETVTLRWAQVAPPEQSRKEAKQDSQEQARKDDAANLRDEVRRVVEEACIGRLPLNRQGVMAVVKGRRQDVSYCLENLVNEGWLYEVEIPTKDRTHPKRSTFLVNFTPAEHGAFTRDGELPEAKLVIPQSWKKAGIPYVPEPEHESIEIQETEGGVA